MTDLPSELRIMTARFDWHRQDAHELKVLQGAADEIERLRKAVSDAHAAVVGIENGDARFNLPSLREGLARAIE